MIPVTKKDTFAFVKTFLDAHTLGVNTVSELIRDCGYVVLFGNEKISKCLDEFKYEKKRKLFINWILENNISRIGISFRLDQEDAVNLVGYLMYEFNKNKMLYYHGGLIRSVYFAGLPQACKTIEKEHNGFVITFHGGESVRHTLTKIGIPEEKIPHEIKKQNSYDEFRIKFGEQIIKDDVYLQYLPINRSEYPEYGTIHDSLIKRIDHNFKISLAPLIRAHVGPYNSSVNRIDSLKEFVSWVKMLSSSNYLDILSIGTSQLTQSNFGEDWQDKINGGGVPINSIEEYKMIWDSSRPLLLRTYAGTKNIADLAKIYERSLNMAWHALSFWWFNKIDGRGPYNLIENLRQHFETLRYVANIGKPFEPNVPHHFAFRGADDVTYVVSAYLATKLAKKMGIRTLILQNMLNTPRHTWGLQDLAKSRALLKLVKPLEDDYFKIILQPRAGLDYFSTDLNRAKIQLAAVTALMDDIEPRNPMSPSIIHVVSYSEASHLATPDVINESIKITQYSLNKYRKLKQKKEVLDMAFDSDVKERMFEIIESAEKIIFAIENIIDKPYSIDGFYKIFVSGFLPTPYLWNGKDEFRYVTAWNTKLIKGGIKVIDTYGNIVEADRIIDFATANLKEADYMLKHSQSQ